MKKTTKTTNSAFYWENRMLALEEKQHKLSKEYFQELKKIHYETLRKVKQSLESYLQRIADNENVSLARAREFIRGEELAEFKWSLETYRSRVLKSENAKLLKMIENASAKQHITRQEAKKKELEMLLYFNYEQSKDLISKSLEESCLNAFNEILKPLSNFRTLDKAVIKGVVNKPWTSDGKTFSKRLWAHHEALANELNVTLQKISTGLNPRREIKLFSAKIASLQKDKTGDLLTKAERIVFTESAAARTRGEIEAFREFGFSSYSIKAVLDIRTSTVCREQNGEVYKLDEFEIGKTAPPFHPYCRSIIVPVEDEKKERENDEYDAPEWILKYIDHFESTEFRRANKSKILLKDLSDSDIILLGKTTQLRLKEMNFKHLSNIYGEVKKVKFHLKVYLNVVKKHGSQIRLNEFVNTFNTLSTVQDIYINPQKDKSILTYSYITNSESVTELGLVYDAPYFKIIHFMKSKKRTVKKKQEKLKKLLLDY